MKDKDPKDIIKGMLEGMEVPEHIKNTYLISYGLLSDEGSSLGREKITTFDDMTIERNLSKWEKTLRAKIGKERELTHIKNFIILGVMPIR